MNNNMFMHIYDARAISFGTDRNEELKKLRNDIVGAIRGEKKIRAPRFIMFKVTDRCNSGCIYCRYAYNKKYDHNLGTEKMTKEQFLEVLEQAAELGIEAIAFNGGEALMREDIIELVHETVKRKILPIIMTNALLLEKYWDELGKIGVRYIIASFDTLDKEVFEEQRCVSYEKTLQGIESLNKMREKYGNVFVHITSVLTSKNLELMPQLVEYCNRNEMWIELSVYDTYNQTQDILSVSDESKLKEFCEYMIQKKREGFYISNADCYFEHLADFCIRKHRIPQNYKCYSGYGIVLLDNDLVVRPCWGHDVIGSLKHNILEELWNNEKMELVRKMMINGQCGGCWNLCTEFNSMCEALLERGDI